MNSVAIGQGGVHQRPRRIAFLHGSNDLYGASRVLVDDAVLLVQQGHDVSVVLPDHGPLDTLLGQAGVTVVVEPLRAFRRVSPWTSRIPVKVPTVVAAADLAVVWTLAVAPYLPTLRARRLRTVCSVHEILLGRAGSALANLATSFSSALMVNSRATQRWVERHNACRRFIELAYPVAPPYDPLPPVPPSAGLRALLAGRVNGHKGHIEAVKAGRKAREMGLDLHLTLVGGSYPGQEHHLALLRAEIGGAEWVSYKGEVSDIRPQLAACDVMLVPTTRPEPFGIVALEAWSAGRRVIASDEGGLAEAAAMVGGILVKPRSEDALAEAMIDIAANVRMKSAPPATTRAATECTLARREDAWTRTLAHLDGLS
jgi:glycosyltransferase involved in cell wall biosynthesis